MSALSGDFAPPPAPAQLAIFGAGAHGREIAWLARQIWGSAVALAFVVDREAYLCPPIYGIAVELLQDYAARCPHSAYVVALGDPGARARCARACDDLGLRPCTLVHPKAAVSRHVELGEGSVICAGSILTVDIRIGRHVHVNIGCTINHDAVFGDFVTLSPGVHVAGHVHIGSRVLVGVGANVINGTVAEPLVIGESAIVAAGACVTTAVPPGVTVAGVPARIIRSHAGAGTNSPAP